MKDEALKEILELLEDDEILLSCVEGFLEVMNESVSFIDGTLVVTNQRMFFCSKDIEGKTFENYRYEIITEIKEEDINNEKIITFKNKNKSINIKIKDIISNNLDKLIAIANNKIINRKPIFY